MSSTHRLRGRTALLAPLLVAGIALGGCGVSDGEQPRPGLAASVEGTPVDLTDVDDTVAGTCAFLDQAEGATAFPRLTVRRLIVETFVRRVAAEKLLDERGVDLPDDYQATVAAIAQQYVDAPGDQAEAMQSGDTASTFVAEAGKALGNALLEDETGAVPTDEDEIAARGDQAIAEWIADHDVDLNPTFGLRLDGGTFVVEDGLSLPASTAAVFNRGVLSIDLLAGDPQQLSEQIPPAVEGLPDDQVCGPTGAAAPAQVPAAPTAP